MNTHNNIVINVYWGNQFFNYIKHNSITCLFSSCFLHSVLPPGFFPGLQEHLFLDRFFQGNFMCSPNRYQFSSNLCLFTERILNFPGGYVCCSRTDTIFSETLFRCLPRCFPNRKQFPGAPCFGYRTDNDFPRTLFWLYQKDTDFTTKSIKSHISRRSQSKVFYNRISRK